MVVRGVQRLENNGLKRMLTLKSASQISLIMEDDDMEYLEAANEDEVHLSQWLRVENTSDEY